MITQEKKIWCNAEDQILKRLYEQGETSWSIVAKRLAAEFGFPRKSAKQCRERYENHICAEGPKVEWLPQEEKTLIELHNQMGNKWSLIAQRIPGKTDNCVKNHFYSKLRKILRKLNSIIHSHLRRQYRPINIGTLYKIVEATEERFKEDPACGYSVSVACQEVQNRMLVVSMLHQEAYDSEERVKIYSDIIRDIVVVSKLYKRKSKKTRNSAIQAPNARRKKIREAHIIVKNPSERGYESDSSSAYDQEALESAKPQQRGEVVIEAQQEGIRDLLKGAGVLKQDQAVVQRPHSVIQFSSRSSFKSYSDHNESDNQFFDESGDERGFGSRRKGSFFRYRNALLEDPSDKQGPDFSFN